MEESRWREIVEADAGSADAVGWTCGAILDGEDDAALPFRAIQVMLGRASFDRGEKRICVIALAPQFADEAGLGALAQVGEGRFHEAAGTGIANAPSVASI